MKIKEVMNKLKDIDGVSTVAAHFSATDHGEWTSTERLVFAWVGEEKICCCGRGDTWGEAYIDIIPSIDDILEDK